MSDDPQRRLNRDVLLLVVCMWISAFLISMAIGVAIGYGLSR